MLHGFDVSAYQGTTIKSCDFVFVKATEGKSYTSSKFTAQWASAERNAEVRGAYHFARPEESSAVSQADRFLSVVKPKKGEMVCLDLEASGLSQADTNAWAKAFGDRIREKAPGVTSVLYLGSGYVSNNTGKDLSKHFDLWWYPQYPSTKNTSTWKTSFTPYLPSKNTTGWGKPHIWQWTDNFGGLDASISTLTIEQLKSPNQAPAPTPTEDQDMAYGGQLPAGKGQQINVSFPRGSMKAIGLVQDNSFTMDGVPAEPQAQVRVAIHRSTGHWQTETVKVGSADGGADHSPKQVVKMDTPAEVDWFSMVRLDDGTRPVGWDCS